MRLWRCFFFFAKFSVTFKNSIQLWENVDGFQNNCVWICCERFCQLWQEYMLSAVNVLKSVPKISYPRRIHDTRLSFFVINEKLTWNCCRANFSSVSDRLTFDFQRVFPNRSFRAFKYSHFSESITSEVLML